MVKSQRNSPQSPSSYRKNLILLIGIIASVKLIIILNIGQSLDGLYPGAWLGSDGETYLAAAESIAQDGIFSKSSLLVYFAPGYPYFLFILQLLTGKLVFVFTSLIQTVLYSYSIYFFCQQLLKTKFRKTTIPFAIIALFNPTLSLSSLVIGYENLVASLLLLTVGLFIFDITSEESKTSRWPMLISSILLGITVWLSPRMILPGFLLVLVWGILKKQSKKNLLVMFLAITILLGFQASIIIRNEIATGDLVSQSSLGTLAIMGAGPNATGTYTNKDTGIFCNVEGLSPSQSSNKKLNCVMNWYAENPVDGLVLLWKKSYYFWSPWFGPLYGGTMARNPYLNFHPVKSSITTQSQLDFVMGTPGQIVSWLWILGGWLLLIIGHRSLIKYGGLQRVIGNVILLLIVSNWLTALVVVGDNRYRLPLMPLSLFLQLCGYMTVRKIKYLSQ